MLAVLLAQFLSAFADNALLFAAIALLRAQSAPAWYAPLLQEFFVVAFVLLAPFVGPCADALPKGRVMLIANGLKFLGALLMLSGLNALACYGLVGVGAAVYSPAKYGILSELVGPESLVKANGLIEGSTIAAILMGAVAGGLLGDLSPTAALVVVACCYLLALAFTLRIPRLPVAHPVGRLSVTVLLRDFGGSVKTLLGDGDARFCILGISLFWGSGATLRFLLVAWVPVALAIDNVSTPANLNAAVAVGIAVGAAAAGRFITLATVNRALGPGLAIGLLVIALAPTQSLPISVVLLVLLGVTGGMFVVPLNALLQERGHESTGAGHAVAILNFFDNLAMLLMVGLYTGAARAGVPVIGVAIGFGLLLLAGMSSLSWWRLRSNRGVETVAPLSD